MAEAALKTQDSLTCPICLDLLKDPVAIPCGHSFCLGCIKHCWAGDDQRKVYSCPQCRHTFTPRPVLNKNTMLAELSEGLRKTRLQAAPPAADSPAGSGGVECDICTGTKHTAVKSCLVCLLSFCEAHIQPHYEIPAYKKHKLVEASMNLQEKICSLHDKLLEVFCRTDQQVICYLCVMDEHSGHKTVSVAAEKAEKQKQLVETQRKSQQRIQQTEKKLQELRQTMETLRRSAQAAVEDSEKIFTELIQSMERRRSEVKELIRAQEKTELSLAEDLLRKLEQEIADLRRRDAELEKLLHSEDPVHFLQSFQSLSAPPQSADLPQIPVSPQFSMEELKKAVTGVMERVEPKLVRFSGGFISSSMMAAPLQRPQQLLQSPEPNTRANFLKWFISSSMTAAPLQKPQQLLQSPEPKTREDFLKYSCQLTLDKNTAHTLLALSERNRKATLKFQKQRYSDHPERFDRVLQVLCRESLSGRCYWEVEFNISNGDIAVCYKNINRKGEYMESGFGFNDQSWSLYCWNSSFSFRHNNKEIKIPVVSRSSRIGVYVDHSAGILSFYSVTDTMTLLHRVHTTFTQPLYPGFGVYYCGNVLQICNLN
ncbi:tripartite motif-containing protein 16-like isoform X1 [Astyanax mexicanus]|uniref:Tripartite motif-containing protein 16-like isoform X1 n=1 Tax=Astyanax mexicanus TaxID=7994 RepID=A0A8T2LFD4_ASTMX|nr:tripartite motif-containing protein 16-like isoform X1 [Astyanax mexicanus]